MHPANLCRGLRRAAGALALAILAANPAGATDYYVSLTGADHQSGRSPSEAWQSIQRVNNHRFLPGDRVLFEGGSTFSGNLYFDRDDAGTHEAPITITSYGTGRATIYAGDGTGIFVWNAAGFRIAQLYIVGSGRDVNTGRGIFFFTDLPGDVKLDFIEIDHVDAVRFGDYGVLIGSHNGATGYRHVRITHTIASENRMGGIFTYAQVPNVHENVYVGYSAAFLNSGAPGLLFNSGNGITLSGVNGGTIERSMAHDNGWLCDANNGPTGIWVFNSTRMVVQFNESYRNLTGGTKDGGGFAFDQNTSWSVMQYNYSHDNMGAGYLLAHKPDNYLHTNNVVRYNVTANDGRKNDYASIHTWGRIRNAEIHNNTVYLTPHPSTIPGVPRAIFIKNTSITLQDPESLHFRNNIIQTTGSLRLIEVQASALDGAKDLRFQGNNYYTTGGSFRIVWGATTYTSLEAWRTATGQERVGTANTGLTVDPRLTAPGQVETFNDGEMIHGLHSYRLQADSLLIDAGLDLRGLGVDPGGRDFFGGALPAGARYDVGAHEYAGECNWTVTPATASAPADGATGRVDIFAALPSCGWSILSNAPWLGVIYEQRYGFGSGQATWWTTPSSQSSARTGTLRIANQTFTVTQAGTGVEEPPPPPPPAGASGEVVLYAATAPVVVGSWRVVSDGTAAGGTRLQNANAGAAKLSDALASPGHYFEMTFNAEAGKPYRLWIRGKAISDHWANDSVFAQFSGSVDAAGAAVYRIGTADSARVNLEDCSGCGLSGWGWQDNGWGTGVLGPPIYFAATGPQTIRIQPREDGLGIDQIVLSPSKYLTTPPGALKNDTTILAPSGGSSADDGDQPSPPPPPPPPPSSAGEVVLYAAEAPVVQGGWSIVADATAAGGARLQNANAGAAKITTALASPVHYFEMTFNAEAGKPYRLWIRGKALSDYWGNDSVHVQFSGSVDASGAAVYRIGTAASAMVNLEDCSGCGLSDWGWQDNGYGAGVLGPAIYFAASGSQMVRIQVREDGLGIDQIVLSPSLYLTSAPGPAKHDTTILPK